MMLDRILTSSTLSSGLSGRLQDFDRLCDQLFSLTETENTILMADHIYATPDISKKKGAVLQLFEDIAHKMFDEIAEEDPTNTALYRYFVDKIEDIYNALKVNTGLQLSIIHDLNKLVFTQEAQATCH